MSKVSIPNPCNEDWNKMTPSKKGAFCGKCQIDVIDFTNKKPIEIKKILLENSGKKMCGHIKKSQLIDLNRDYTEWENQSLKAFHSKFTWACIMVFGMTLFTSCNNSISPDQSNTVGEMEIHLVDTVINDTNCDTVEIIDGKIAITEDTVCLDTQSKSTVEKPLCPTEPDMIDLDLLGDIDIHYDGAFEVEPDYYDSIDSSNFIE